LDIVIFEATRKRLDGMLACLGSSSL